MYKLLNTQFFFSEMVLCDAFHTKYTKHLRKRNYYLVYQRIKIINTNAYFKIVIIHVGTYIHGVPILWGSLNCVCMQCSGSCLLYYSITITLVGVALGKIFVSRSQCNNTRQEVGLGLGGLFLGILGSGKHRK